MTSKETVRPARDHDVTPSGPFDVTPEASPEPCDAEDMYEEAYEEVSDEEEHIEELSTSLMDDQDHVSHCGSFSSSPDTSFFFGRKPPVIKTTVAIPVDFDDDEYII